MARGWKRHAETIAAASPIPALARWRNAPSVVVLAYHNIVPRGETAVGELSLHTSQSAFSDQLDVILESCEIVSLDEALVDLSAAPRTRVVISFDDAYRGAMSAGLEELRKRGLPATVFVAPGLLGNEGCWWDLLSAGPAGSLPAGAREHALGPLQGKQDRVLEWARAEDLALASLPAHALPTTEEELLRDAAGPGVSLAVHSWAHPNLATLSEADCAEEMSRAKQWLLERAPQFCDWLAYPYGRRSPEAIRAASRQHRGAMLVDGGPAALRGRPVDDTRFETPRVNVPRGLTPAGLQLRLAGLLR